MSRRKKGEEGLSAPAVPVPPAAAVDQADALSTTPAVPVSGPPPDAPPLPAPTPEELLAAHFKGGRATLRPVYEVLLHVARRIDPRVKVLPERTGVRFLRQKRTFAVVKTAPEPRIDLGLSLGEVAPRGRLKRGRVGGVEGITHKVELFRPSSVDADVVLWMKKAWGSAR